MSEELRRLFKDLTSGGPPTQLATKWITIVAAIGYVAFPIMSGAWFQDRVQCTYLWSEVAKNGLSMAAYIALGVFVWKKRRPDVLSNDVATNGYALAAFFGGYSAFCVLEQCW